MAVFRFNIYYENIIIIIVRYSSKLLKLWPQNDVCIESNTKILQHVYCFYTYEYTYIISNYLQFLAYCISCFHNNISTYLIQINSIEFIQVR